MIYILFASLAIYCYIDRPLYHPLPSPNVYPFYIVPLGGDGYMAAAYKV